MSALDELHDAITRKDAAAATRALDADPGLATARTASGQTPALVAIYGRAPQILALLRSRGARFDVFEAAAAGDVDRVRALLDTDPSLRDAHARDGWTPLHLAGHFRQTATIELLLDRRPVALGAGSEDVDHVVGERAPDAIGIRLRVVVVRCWRRAAPTRC